MADNKQLPATGTGTPDVVQATDEIAGVDYPLVKLVDGTADSTTVVQAGGGVEAGALRVTIATDSTGVLSVDDNGASLTVDGVVTAVGSAADGAAVSGNPVLVAGQDGTNVQSFKTDSTGRLEVVDGGQSITVDGTVTASQGTAANLNATVVQGTAASLNATVVQSTAASLKVEPAGGIAHDGVDSGNPVKVGARAISNLAGATMVAAADRTDNMSDLDGVLLTRPACPIGNILRHHQGVTGTTSTAATAFGAVASTRNMISSVVVHNSSAVDTFVELQDGSGGTTFCVIPAPAKGGAVVDFSDVHLPQPTANLGLFFKANSAGTTVYATILGYQTKAG